MLIANCILFTGETSHRLQSHNEYGFLLKKSGGNGATDTVFWISNDVSSGFQSQSGQCYSYSAEVYVMYIPQDSPLLCHLLTS